jgi:hypothetical protein
MTDKNGGCVEVEVNDRNQIVAIHPGKLSVQQARDLADLLLRRAAHAEYNIRRNQEDERRREAAKIPVDLTDRTLLDGSPVTPGHREIDPTTGMQKDYVVLSAAERAKGFVRPVRRTYRHLKCNTTTTMGLALAETCARSPVFYSGAFCCQCRAHFPLVEFVWDGTDEPVGS